MTQRRRTLLLILLVVVVLNVVVWVLVLYVPNRPLIVSFLNVGQGDAIFIQSPTGVQMLIDGGRDRSVLRELGKHMSPLDRSIDLVVATHPDADHIGGLTGVLQRYRVGTYLSSDGTSETNTAQALRDAVSHEKGVDVLHAKRGQRILLGDGAYADVLFPDRSVAGVESNTGSIIMRVVYGETSFMLSGDAPSSIEDWIVALDGPSLESQVLKAGHHGSRTSTDETWLAAVDPNIVVISAGKDNSYGHPHQEVLERIAGSGASVLSTVEGAVSLISNGVDIRHNHYDILWP